MTDAELRTWAEAHAPAGSPLAVGILRLLAERDELAEHNAYLKRLVGDANRQLVAAEAEAGEHRAAMAFVRRYAADPAAARAECGPVGVPWLDAILAELADARRVCESLAARCAGQAELLAARAAKEGGA